MHLLSTTARFAVSVIIFNYDSGTFAREYTRFVLIDLKLFVGQVRSSILCKFPNLYMLQSARSMPIYRAARRAVIRSESRKC